MNRLPRVRSHTRFSVSPRRRFLAGVVLAAMVGFAAASSSGGSAVRASAPTASKPLHNLLPARIQSAGAIRIASDLNYPPLDYFKPDGTTPTGADYDIAQVLGKKLEVKMEFTNVTFDNIIPSLLRDSMTLPAPL